MPLLLLLLLLSSSSITTTPWGPTRLPRPPPRPSPTRRCSTETLRPARPGCTRRLRGQLRELLPLLLPSRLRLLLLRGPLRRTPACTAGLTEKESRKDGTERRERKRLLYLEKLLCLSTRSASFPPPLFLSLSRRLVVFFSLPRERNFFSTPLTNNSSHAFLLNLFAMARFLAFVYALAVAVVLSASPISASSRCVWCFRWLREGERER